MCLKKCKNKFCPKKTKSKKNQKKNKKGKKVPDTDDSIEMEDKIKGPKYNQFI